MPPSSVRLAQLIDFKLIPCRNTHGPPPQNNLGCSTEKMRRSPSPRGSTPFRTRSSTVLRALTAPQTTRDGSSSRSLLGKHRQVRLRHRPQYRRRQLDARTCRLHTIPLSHTYVHRVHGVVIYTAPVVSAQTNVAPTHTTHTQTTTIRVYYYSSRAIMVLMEARKNMLFSSPLKQRRRVAGLLFVCDGSVPVVNQRQQLRA